MSSGCFSNVSQQNPVALQVIPTKQTGSPLIAVYLISVQHRTAFRAMITLWSSVGGGCEVIAPRDVTQSICRDGTLVSIEWNRISLISEILFLNLSVRPLATATECAVLTAHTCMHVFTKTLHGYGWMFLNKSWQNGHPDFPLE